jgi:hypothetical protein
MLGAVIMITGAGYKIVAMTLYDDGYLSIGKF